MEIIEYLCYQTCIMFYLTVKCSSWNPLMTLVKCTSIIMSHNKDIMSFNMSHDKDIMSFNMSPLTLRLSFTAVIIFWQCWPCTLGNFLLLEYNKIIQSNQNFINNSYMKCFSLFFHQVSLNAVTPWSHIPSHRAEHLHLLIITLHDYYIPLSYVQCIASPVVTMGV